MKTKADKMDIIRDIFDIAKGGEAKAVALGTFDGMHRGHTAVINAAAQNSGYIPAAFTFSSNPHGGSLLVTESEKIKLIGKCGIEKLYVADFEQIKDMSPEAFFHDILRKRINAKKICCGEDFRFGKNAGGDTKLLKELCRAEETELEIVPPVLYGGELISSTRIREALKDGEVRLANELLGRVFGFSLEVIHGNHIGTGLGMPTINQALPEGFVLPKFGVYASFARVDGELFCGVTNIGVKPTVGSDRVLSETWMPAFSGDLYGKKVRLCIIDFIRAERKFPSLDAMKEQVALDAEKAKKITGEYMHKNGIDKSEKFDNSSLMC